MPARVAARLALTASGLTLALWALALALWGLGGFGPLGVYAGQPRLGDLIVRAAELLAYGAIAAMGLLVAARHPRNPIGWMLGAIGLQVAFVAAVREYGALAALRPALATPALPPLAWLATWLAAVANTLGVLALLLFPDGRPPSARWRPLLALALLLGVVQAAVLALRPGPLALAPGVANPVGVPALAEPAAWLTGATVSGFLLAQLLAAAALLARLRRARGDRRRQLRWVAYAAVAYAALLAATYPLPMEWMPVHGVLHYLALAALALALGVALLRHRLYELDLVVTRALVYGALALCVTGLYVVVVGGVGALVGAGDAPNVWRSVLATAAVAVAFEPLRARLQALANRLVYGQRASPYEVLADFSRRVAGALSADEAPARMAEAAARGVGAARGWVRVAVPGGSDRTVAWPPDAPAVAGEHALPVRHQGVLVGEVAVAMPPGEPLRPAEARLLADLAAQAGPALRAVQLTLELEARLAQLAAQAEELRASRGRIAAAQDAERRRLERDLHDGAQQRLVALAVQLRLLKGLIAADPARAAALVDDLLGQAVEALAELRDLARGVFPPLLADRGLAAAVAAHLARILPAARLEAEAGLDGARFAPALETAVYFCLREALQNAAKHAPGAAVTVRLAREPGRLTFAVRDDGPGFDPASAAGGAGLQGMADRMAAVGGGLEVDAPAGGGARVRGWAPIEPAPAAHDGRAPVAAAQAAASAAGPNSALAR